MKPQKEPPSNKDFHMFFVVLSALFLLGGLVALLLGQMDAYQNLTIVGILLMILATGFDDKE